jgi:uncharacterized membrane protein YcjF (UPF0283 family)
MDLVTLVTAAAEHGEESSKAAFYIAGGLLVAWAVVLTAVGMTRQDFPGTATAARGVMGISAVLVLAAMAAIVLTA